MEVVEYDEDIRENRFYRELRSNHEEVIEKASRSGWIICVPRRGTILEAKRQLTEDDLAGHVLVPSVQDAACTEFRTLNNRPARLEGKLLAVDGEAGTFSSYLLFEETFYDERFTKYRVWCIDRALEEGCGTTDGRVTGISTVQDAVGFLWSEIPDERVLKELVTVIERFEDGCTDLESKPIEVQRDLINGLYNSCLVTLLKDPRLRSLCSTEEHFCKNLKISLETYLLYSLRGTLRRSVSACTASQDSELNKTLRNSTDLQLSDLEVRPDLCDRIHVARLKLSRLDRFATVLGKTECLKRTVRCLSEGSPSVSSDDLLPALVFLVIKAGLSNWIAQLTFMKYFRFSVNSVYEADEAGFLITSLEAAIEHLRTGGFLKNLETVRTVQTDNQDSSPLVQLFSQIERGDLAEVRNTLAKERTDSVHDISLCHPLCTCETCERKRNQQNSFKGPSVNTEDESGRTSVHVAALHDRLDILEYLLTLGPDMNAIDNEERTALHYAAASGHSKTITRLLEANADPEVLDLNKNTPLHLATEHGHEDCVRVILEKTGPVTLNSTNLDGDTALHRASKWGYQGIVKLLLAHGANPVARNKRGQTPLSLAHNDQVSDMLVGFATSVKPFRPAPMYTVDSESDSDSGIIVSTTVNNAKEYSLDSNTRAMEKLFAAISEGDTCLACYYLGLETRRNRMVRDTMDLCHPLCDCDRCTDLEDTVDRPGATLASGLGVNACNGSGETALHLASALGSQEMVRVLLDAGANVNACTVTDRRTPLHFACLCDNLEVVRLLLDCATCDVDSRDRNGDTPLHLAVKTGNARLVRLLLRYGASTDCRNSRGATPLQQLQQQISKDALSFPLLDISNILKRKSFENAVF